MGIQEDLTNGVKQIFKESWSTRDGQVVPEPSNLKLGNDAVSFDRATIIYADLSGSTAMVNTVEWQLAAEVYKAYLLCAARLIRSEGGIITSYDGDRVMGVFVGKSQTRPAVRCGLKINYAVQQIINPALQSQYPHSTIQVKQVVGIDTSSIRAARTGVRGDNDIVWVGRAANYAAKLTNLDMAERTWITAEAYAYLTDEERLGGPSKAAMWKAYTWTAQGGHQIYGSTWWWRVPS